MSAHRETCRAPFQGFMYEGYSCESQDSDRSHCFREGKFCHVNAYVVDQRITMLRGDGKNHPVSDVITRPGD